MDFTKVIQERRSVRKYDLTRSVPEEALQRILEAVRIAPSAANRQPWHFIVVKDEKVKTKLKEAYPNIWFYTAPVIIVGCVDQSKAWVRKDGLNEAMVDLGIAMTHLVLAAYNEGLGTCWVGALNEEKARETLGVPAGIQILAMTPLGYSLDTGTLNRKPLSEIIHYDKW